MNVPEVVPVRPSRPSAPSRPWVPQVRRSRGRPGPGGPCRGPRPSRCWPWLTGEPASGHRRTPSPRCGWAPTSAPTPSRWTCSARVTGRSCCSTTAVWVAPPTRPARFRHRGPWSVGSMTLAEVRRLDAGSWKSPRWAGERVPTLGEILTEVGRPPRAAAAAGAEAARAAPRHRRRPRRRADRPPARGGWSTWRTSSCSPSTSRPSRSSRSGARRSTVGILGLPPRGHLPALGTWAGQVNPHHAALDASYVEAVHANGMRCLTWTVDRRFSMRRALRAGVDGVITNRPDVLLQQR